MNLQMFACLKGWQTMDNPITITLLSMIIVLLVGVLVHPLVGILLAAAGVFGAMIKYLSIEEKK